MRRGARNAQRECRGASGAHTGTAASCTDLCQPPGVQGPPSLTGSVPNAHGGLWGLWGLPEAPMAGVRWAAGGAHVPRFWLKSVRGGPEFKAISILICRRVGPGPEQRKDPQGCWTVSCGVSRALRTIGMEGRTPQPQTRAVEKEAGGREGLAHGLCPPDPPPPSCLSCPGACSGPGGNIS